jgi:hypothetical protein
VDDELDLEYSHVSRHLHVLHDMITLFLTQAQVTRILEAQPSIDIRALLEGCQRRMDDMIW